MIRNLIVPAVLLAFAAPSLSFAGKLADKSRDKEFMTQIEKGVKETKAKCGAEITASADWSKYNEETWKGQSLGGYCEKAYEALRTVCAKSDDYKKAVAEHVKSVKCIFEADKPKDKKPEFALKGTTLEYVVRKADWKPADEMAKYLVTAVDK